MQLHSLQPKTSRSSKKRVGRGGKRGTYSGKGQKGQKSRAGAKMRPGLRDVLISTPKLRGFDNKPTSPPRIAVTLGTIAKLKETEITPRTLLKHGILRRTQKAKIVAGGLLESKKHITGIPVSSGAKKLIEEAGGNVKE